MRLTDRRFRVIAMILLSVVNATSMFGQKGGFASKFTSAVEAVQKAGWKDPDTFKDGIVRLEKEWGERKDPVEQSVVHALLGSAYREMKWTSISDFDEETRSDYEAKRKEHFSHVLDNMDALADAKADAYAALLSRRGKDDDIYKGDMLSVMFRFVKEQGGLDDEEILKAEEQVFNVYRRRGNMAGYAAVKLLWLEDKRHAPKRLGSISLSQLKDSLQSLLQEVKATEMGADVALEHEGFLQDRDEKITHMRWALQNVADSRCKAELKRLLDEAVRPSVSMHGEHVLVADRPSKMKLDFWNCESTTLTVRRYAGRKPSKRGDGELILTGAVVRKQDLTFELDEENVQRKAKDLPVKGTKETEFTLPVGHYVLVAEGAGCQNAWEFHVSTIHIFVTEKNKEEFRLHVMDNETGRPLPGVKVQCREKLPDLANRTQGWESRDLAQELTTGADGVADVKKKMWVRAVRSDQDYTNYSQTYGSWYLQSDRREQVTMRVMTDRVLYRPGQKVQGTVMVYAQKGDSVKVKGGLPVTLTVKNGEKELCKLQLVTSEWGTVAFDCPLPDDCEVGSLTLRAYDSHGHGGRGYVRVEEYKRPTFDVKFEGAKSGKYGQTVEVKGKAMLLAGAPVQGAVVHYRVECAPCRLRWWWYGSNDWNEVSEGEAVTDDEGVFRVPVLLTDDYVTENTPLTRFKVTATVTDMNGESHENEWTLNVSKRDVVLEASVAQEVDVAKDASFKVMAYNANHEPLDMKGRYRILSGEQQVAEGEFQSGEPVKLSPKLPLGVNCKLEAVVTDTDGNEVKESSEFVAYSSALPVTKLESFGTGAKQRTQTAMQSVDFLYSDSTAYEAGGTVDLYLATQEADAYIIYNVYNAKGLIEHKEFVTDGTMKRLRLRHSKEWGEGIAVRVMYVRNGHSDVMERNFTLVKPEKRLKVEWATFRDKLQPGQKEEWKLVVSDWKGRRVNAAEMMAVLYDASLDRIFKHSWNFSLAFMRELPNFRIIAQNAPGMPSFTLAKPMDDFSVYSRSFDELRGYVHNRFLRTTRNAPLMLSKGAVADQAVFEGKSVAMVEESAAMDAAPLSANVGGTLREVRVSARSEVEMADFDKADLRENFAETAFFMPNLLTDAKGQVNISFTLPESLTEWQFMGLAHTKDVDYGTILATAVARKDFMLRPNMPRFVRWGDKAVLASSVVNQSEKNLEGAVRMRLLDAKTGQVVLTEEKPFTVEAGKTTSVDFDFDVKEEWGDMECELVAVSGGTSDGEKHLLPVLSTKQAVVEAVPFYVKGNADGTPVEKTVDVSALFNGNSSTATQRRLQVEYTDNPAWMCIEALRSVKNPECDNAIDYAASLYANTRLMQLMQTFPVLAEHEKAEDLQKRVDKAMEKLTALQRENGGWSWFAGMDGNYWVTLAVCEQLAKLQTPTPDVEAMLEQGMNFLDKKEVERYERVVKREKKYRPGNMELRYLYLSAQMPRREVGKDVQKMREFYLSRVERDPEALTIYGVANVAYALRAFDHVKAADKYVAFLKDYTVEKPGQGRFYATDAAYYSWMDYRIPTQVAAMKAIRQKDSRDAFLDDMQLWLIAQKQVQKWDNPMNTIDVADLLLQVSPTETFHAVRKPVLRVDGTELENMDHATINTERDRLEGRESNLVLEGNVLAEVPEPVVEKGVGQLDVTKTTQGISWGAAYATFMEDMTRLKPYATDELKVQRKVYVQRAGESDWTEWTEKAQLKVGDKVRVRHIVTADRDMDFVHVTAQHPACLEPVQQLSGYRRMGGRGGYLVLHDTRSEIFFDWFTRGTATVDLEYYVSRAGEYEFGVSSVECLYAKQFGAHTDGMRIQSKKAQ